MPKLKTHKSLIKRIRTTGKKGNKNPKIKRVSAKGNHLATPKGASQLRRLKHKKKKVESLSKAPWSKLKGMIKSAKTR